MDNDKNQIMDDSHKPLEEKIKDQIYLAYRYIESVNRSQEAFMTSLHRSRDSDGIIAYNNYVKEIRPKIERLEKIMSFYGIAPKPYLTAEDLDKSIKKVSLSIDAAIDEHVKLIQLMKEVPSID